MTVELVECSPKIIYKTTTSTSVNAIKVNASNHVSHAPRLQLLVATVLKEQVEVKYDLRH